MRVIDLNRLQSAITSITSCTSPSFQVGGIVVQAYRLCSPYRSRHTVEFAKARQNTPRCVIRAWNSCHALDIATVPVTYMPAPRTFGTMVGRWIELTVPASLVWPVIEFAQGFLGELIRFPANDDELIQVWVLVPHLAGYHFGKPVFYLAAAPEPGAENEVMCVPEAPEDKIIRQGHLFFVPKDGLDIGTGWYTRERFFNHLHGDEEKSESLYERTAVTPVAVEYSGQAMCAVHVYGPARITSRDHNPIELPEGSWIALHPFPSRQNGVVD